MAYCWRQLLTFALVMAGVLAGLFTPSATAVASDWQIGGRLPGSDAIHPQGSCVDDVSIEVLDPADVNFGYFLKDPPDYTAEAEIRIYYTVSNHSCQDVEIRVELRGSQSGAIIHNGDDAPDLCLEECVIEPEGASYGKVLWDLAQHPEVAGEQVVATISVLSPEGFTDLDAGNDSATSEAGINVKPSVSVIDVGISSVTSSHSEAPVGTSIEFTTVVANVGSEKSSPTAHFYLDGEMIAVDSATITDLGSDQSESVTLVWDTTGADIGSHDVRITIDVADDASADDNEWSTSIDLQDPVVDLRITALGTSIAVAAVGESVNLSITIANYGDFDAEPGVDLYLGDDISPIVSTVTAPVPPGGEITSVLVWDTTGVEAKEHVLKVEIRADLDSVDTVDEGTVNVTLNHAANLALISALVADAPTIAGEAVRVEIVVENVGATDAESALIALYVRGQPEPLVSELVDFIGRGKSATINLDWETVGLIPGQYDLQADVSVDGEIDLSNNSRQFSVTLRNWTKLAWASVDETDKIAGDIVAISAGISNEGAEQLENLTLGLYYPGNNSPLATTIIPSVAGGETQTAELSWDTRSAEPGVHQLLVSVDTPDTLGDPDDSVFLSVPLHNEISILGARQEPSPAIVGSPATIIAEVRNDGQRTLDLVSVKLSESGASTVAAEKGVATLPSGNSATVEFTLDTAGFEPGVYQYIVTVEMPDRAGDGNDSWPVSIALRNPKVDVALVAAVPSTTAFTVGEIVEIRATVANRGEAPITVPVSMYVDDRGAVASSATTGLINPGATGAGVMTWDTQGVTDGARTLRTTIDVPGDAATDDNTLTLSVRAFQSAFDSEHPADQCAQDVAVQVIGIHDQSGELATLPNYDNGDVLRVGYRISNYSCGTDVQARLALSGSESGAAINDDDEPCLSECTIPTGGMLESWAQWQLLAHPAALGERVLATVTVLSPSDFSDVETQNNGHESTNRINVASPSHIAVHMGSHESFRGKFDASLGLTGFDPQYSAGYPTDGGPAIAGIKVAPVDLVAGTMAFVTAFAANWEHSGAAFDISVALDDVAVSIAPVRNHILEARWFTAMTFHWLIPNDVVAGPHVVTANIINPDSAVSENVALSESVSIRQPEPGPVLDNIWASPDQALLGASIAVRVAIRNTDEIAQRVPVSLYVGAGAKPVATATTGEIQPGESAFAMLVWDSPAGASPGAYLLRARTGDSEQSITVNLRRASASISIGDVSVSPAVAILGEHEAAEITAVLTNTGDTAVKASATLHINQLGHAVDSLSGIAMSPGSTHKVTLAWMVPDETTAGEYQLRMEVGGPEKGAAPFDTATKTITVRGPYSDRELLTVYASPSPADLGEPVSIAVTVLNPQDFDAQIPIILGFPGNTRQDEHRNPRVKAHQSVTRQFEWRTGNLEPGEYQLPVSASVAGRTISAVVTVVLRVDAEIISVESSPDQVIQGQPVEIAVAVRNNGSAALNLPITLNYPSLGKSPERRSPRIGPGETEVATFQWLTRNYEPGIHRFRIVLGAEWSGGAGVDSRMIDIALLPPQVDFEVKSVVIDDPGRPFIRGEWVGVRALVRNAGSSPGRGTVTLRDLTHGHDLYAQSATLQPKETKRVEFTWKTLRYELGHHEFQIITRSQHDSNDANDHSKPIAAELAPYLDTVLAWDGKHILPILPGDIRPPLVG